MNKVYIMCGVGGFVFGCVATIAAESIYSRFIKDNEEIEITHKERHTTLKKRKEEVIKKESCVYSESETCENIDFEGLDTITKKEGDDMHKIIKNESYLSDENDDINRHITNDKEYDTEDIYLIDSEEYGSIATFDIESLTYYAKEDILCDDRDIVIENPRNIIGSIDIANEFIDDILYIRDQKHGIDYELIYSTVPYYEPGEDI